MIILYGVIALVTLFLLACAAPQSERSTPHSRVDQEHPKSSGKTTRDPTAEYPPPRLGLEVLSAVSRKDELVFDASTIEKFSTEARSPADRASFVLVEVQISNASTDWQTIESHNGVQNGLVLVDSTGHPHDKAYTHRTGGSTFFDARNLQPTFTTDKEPYWDDLGGQGIRPGESKRMTLLFEVNDAVIAGSKLSLRYWGYCETTRQCLLSEEYPLLDLQ